MSRHRSSSKRAPPEIGLHMECIEEELEPSQIAYYNKAEKEYNEVQAKLENYVKKMKAEVVEKGENCVVLQLNATPPSVSLGSPNQILTPTTGGKTTRQSVQTSQNYQQMVGQGILTRSNANSAGNTYLVMDPRLGFMVGQMQSPNVSTEQPAASTTPKAVSTSRGRQTATSGAVMVTTRAKSSLKKQASTASEPEVTPPMTRTRDKAKNQAQGQQPVTPQSSAQVIQQQQQVYSTASTSSTTGNYRIKVNAKQVPPPSKPTENNALGGLSAGSKTPWKQNTDETSGSKSSADSREVTFNKVTGKTFPSLVVIARPHLKVKYIPQSNIAQERTALDAKVKGVLMYTSTKFTEWLIQQGLIRSEQMCQTHVNNDLSPVKLKLGMYSDVSKFPYSGGYVWISDCCPSQFVSVFSGSIFEGAPHSPTTLLKLIYHWACQTNAQNVVQWVKVDNLYVKNFFTNMRAVCTQAVHEKYKRMGGPRKKIEVGVISLGTTSQDGNRRQVKVEVLGVMDQESKLVRLRAVEPLSDERSFKRRFIKILEPLEEWVSKESTILTDFTVAKAALNSMGFHTVFQVTTDTKYSNQNVMEYLRRIVPRMFQNTLSLLSRQIIQQFLDELVWREMWGPIPSQAFVNIIAHMAEQTKLDVAENFLVRLNKVASNPFKRWDYSVWKPVINSMSNTKTQQGTSTSQESSSGMSMEVSETPPTGKGIRTRKRAAEQQSMPENVASPVPPKKVPKVTVKEKMKKEEKTKSVEKVVKKEKESVEKLSEEIIKFINESKQIPLDSYYYGSKNGDEYLVEEFRGPFNVRCCVCNKRFTENIALMKHMILHCQIEPALVIDLKKVQQCESCFLGFNTSDALKSHMEEVHFVFNNKLDANLLCQICEEKFTNRNDLIYHMHRTHVELELPYECGVCWFRTSIYKVFVDHFTQVHRGEEYVFCPYCLKVVTFAHKGVAITSNVLFYVSHLEKHQRLTLMKDCTRCQLSFIHKGILDQHLEADHISWKNEEGVQSINESQSSLLMPEPGAVIKLAPAVKPYKSPKTKNLFTVTKFKTLGIYGLDEDMACVECEGFLTKSDHFTGNFNCLKCRYSSCCERAMAEHLAIFHETPNPQFTMGKPIVLPEEKFCVCGYSSRSGNRIAKHLALCERKSAYSSKEAAASAVQSRTVKDKMQEKLKQGEGQNVLNMLGLVRKSPEGGTVATEPMKKELEEEEISTEIDVKQEKQEVEAPENKIQVEAETNESQAVDSDLGGTSEPLLAPKNEDVEGKVVEEEAESNSKVQTVAESEVSSNNSILPLEEDEDSKKPLETAMDIAEEEKTDKTDIESLQKSIDFEEQKESAEDEAMEVQEDECEEKGNDVEDQELDVPDETPKGEVESSPQVQDMDCESKKNEETTESQMEVDPTVSSNEENSEIERKAGSENKDQSEEVEGSCSDEKFKNEEISAEILSKESDENNGNTEKEAENALNTDCNNQNPDGKEIEDKKESAELTATKGALTGSSRAIQTVHAKEDASCLLNSNYILNSHFSFYDHTLFMENTRRNAYDAALKLKAIDLAVKEGNRAAARTLGINESMVRRWRRQREELTQCKKTTKAFRGNKSRWPELENVLEDWVNTQRADGQDVSTEQIRLKAKAIATEMNIEDFKGGPSWCLRFMRRKGLSVRAGTTLCQQFPSNSERETESAADEAVLGLFDCDTEEDDLGDFSTQEEDEDGDQ